MVFISIKEKQQLGCLSSYKIENLFLEAAAAWHQQGTRTLRTACPLHFFLRLGYSQQGRNGLHRTALPAEQLRVNLSHVSATSSLTATVWVFGEVGGITAHRVPYRERSKSETKLINTHLPGSPDSKKGTAFTDFRLV